MKVCVTIPGSKDAYLAKILAAVGKEALLEAAATVPGMKRALLYWMKLGVNAYVGGPDGPWEHLLAFGAAKGVPWDLASIAARRRAMQKAAILRFLHNLSRRSIESGSIREAFEAWREENLPRRTPRGPRPVLIA